MTWAKFIQKVSSRKFWALIAGFVGSLMVAMNVGENEIAQITAIVTSFGTIAVYIFAEASVDKAGVQKEVETLKLELKKLKK
jgi:hypothetical protein